MSVIFFIIAVCNMIGFIVRGRRWGNGGPHFDAAVAACHLTMAIVLLWAALYVAVAA